MIKFATGYVSVLSWTQARMTSLADEGLLMMAVEDLVAGFVSPFFCRVSFPSVRVGSDAWRVSLKIKELI